MIKKIAVSVVACLISSMTISCAYEFPNAVWTPHNAYLAAKSSGDASGLITFGKQVIEVMKNEPDVEEKWNMLGDIYARIPQAAEQLGDYEMAIQLYREYLPYGIRHGWDDGVKYANAKIDMLQSDFNVYYEKPGQGLYFWAKNEPVNGIYYGSTYDNDPRIGTYDVEKIRGHFPKEGSNYLIYLVFLGEDLTVHGTYQKYIENAKQYNKNILLAWNVQHPITDVAAHEQYIKSQIDYLADTGLKIYLRFGAEMNVNELASNPEAYISSFRYVADYAKTKGNIAMVWSPTDIGGLDAPFGLFYPGDEYVDWVGVSLYALKYFQGKRDHGTQTDPVNTYFATGEFATPLNRIRPIVKFMEENNIKKPLMMSEGGVTHFVRTENEDTTEFAILQMRKLYGELIRAYPQIKLMNYFNVERPKEENDYALYTNNEVHNLYNAMVAQDIFINDAAVTDVGFHFEKMHDGTFDGAHLNLSVSAYYPKITGYTKVKYLIDGNEVYNTDYAPYQYSLPISELTGQHKLTVQLLSGQNLLLQKDYMISGSGIVNETPVSAPANDDITIFVNGDIVEFIDQQPMLVDGSTLIPARGVFEKMGALVDWDGSTSTATVTYRDTILSIKIDSKVIMKNGSEPIEILVPAQLINGRTMLPLRAISEALGADVQWFGETQEITITH